MKDEIKRFRERRDARIKAKRADEEWITMHGTHVLIDDEGQVSKGPETLKSVVKSGGGYKSKAERKYGSNAKYAKALSNGWNQRNKPDTNKPSAGKYIETLEKAGLKYDPKSQEHGESKYEKGKTALEKTKKTDVPKKIMGQDVIQQSDDGDVVITYSQGDMGAKYKVRSKTDTGSWKYETAFKTQGEADKYMRQMAEMRKRRRENPASK